MRQVKTQHDIEKRALFSAIKKLQTSLNYLHVENVKDDIKSQTVVHVSDDALAVFMWAEKFALLRLMMNTEEPDDRYDDAN